MKKNTCLTIYLRDTVPDYDMNIMYIYNTYAYDN